MTVKLIRREQIMRGCRQKEEDYRHSSAHCTVPPHVFTCMPAHPRTCEKAGGGGITVGLKRREQITAGRRQYNTSTCVPRRPSATPSRPASPVIR